MKSRPPLTEDELIEWSVNYKVILFDAMHCVDTLEVLHADSDGQQVITRTGFAHMMWNVYEQLLINSLDKLCHKSDHNHFSVRGLCNELQALRNGSWLTDHIAQAPPKTLQWTSWDQVDAFTAYIHGILKEHRKLIRAIHDWRNTVVGHSWASFAPSQKPRPLLQAIEQVEAKALVDSLQLCHLQLSGGVFGEATFPMTQSVTLRQIIDMMPQTGQTSEAN